MSARIPFDCDELVTGAFFNRHECIRRYNAWRPSENPIRAGENVRVAFAMMALIQEAESHYGVRARQSEGGVRVLSEEEWVRYDEKRDRRRHRQRQHDAQKRQEIDVSKLSSPSKALFERLVLKAAFEEQSDKDIRKRLLQRDPRPELPRED